MKLQGKIVKINGNKYLVQSEKQADGQEILILSRELDEHLDQYPTTIQDLGYNSTEDIKFSQKKIKKIQEVISNLYTTGHEFEISTVDRSGLIVPQKISIIPEASERGYFWIKQAGASSVKTKLSFKLLMDSLLLNKQLKKAQKKYVTENTKTSKIDKIIDSGMNDTHPNSELKKLMQEKSFSETDKEIPDELKILLDGIENLVGNSIASLELAAKTKEEKELINTISTIFKEMKNIKK